MNKPFHFHFSIYSYWSHWHQYTVSFRDNEHSPPYAMELRQQRRCFKCGTIEDELVSINGSSLPNLKFVGEDNGN